MKDTTESQLGFLVSRVEADIKTHGEEIKAC
jgi:hypothetical protein